MTAREKAAELYTYNGTDPGIVTALRSAFRAGAEWQATTWGWAEDVHADHLSGRNVHEMPNEDAAREAVALDPTGRVLVHRSGSAWRECTQPSEPEPSGD